MTKETSLTFNRNIDLDAEEQLCGMMLLNNVTCCVAQEY